MNWQPIKYYDAMAKKPKHCVFYVEEDTTGRNLTLPARISAGRFHGDREVTKFIELPDPED